LRSNIGTHSPQNIASYSFLLGFGAGISLVLAIVTSSGFGNLLLYFAFLAFFHFLEYLFSALFNGHKLNLEGLLLQYCFYAYSQHFYLTIHGNIKLLTLALFWNLFLNSFSVQS
jgi:hypothetical protein